VFMLIFEVPARSLFEVDWRLDDAGAGQSGAESRLDLEAYPPAWSPSRSISRRTGVARP